MPKTKQQVPLAKPHWVEELSIKYQSGIACAFVLHGNVQDYIAGQAGRTLRNYLLYSFADREVTVYWNRATGFSLPTKEMRERFAEIAGIAQHPTIAPGKGGGGGLAGGLNAAAATPQDLVLTLEKIRQVPDALECINKLVRYKPPKKDELFRSAIILDYAETIAPAGDSVSSDADRTTLVTLAEWGRDPAIASHDTIIVMIVSELHDLNERLRRSGARWEQIAIPFPSFEERAEFAKSLVADAGSEVEMDDGFSYEELARLTTGLRFIDLEDIVLRASFHQEPISKALVKQRKDEIMASEFEEVLQVVENEFGFEAIGGMQEVKQDLTETIIQPMHHGQFRVVPQGVLLMGPAGTGKTILAKALAKEAGLTFVELQPSKIFSKWVGDTERRLERALSAIRAMTPCIVFIDEIDQAISRSEGGDSGTSSRVFKRLMEVMSDTSLRGKVLWIAATNRPDLLDAALRRPGRLDKKIPILAPDAKERAGILSVLTKAAFPTAQLPSDEAYLSLAQQMDDYTGAEIEGVVGKAVQLFAKAEGSLSIEEALTQAYTRIIPTTQDIERMTSLALMFCNDLDLVPSHLRERARLLRHPQAQQELQTQLDEGISETYNRRQRKL